jgi:nucleoside-diphosphate-sugar epimerase
MKIFVTGGTGFIGSHFINNAIKAGHQLICIRRPNSKPRINIERHPTWLTGQLDDDWEEYLKGCDALVHLSACGVSPQKASREEMLKWNINASYKLILSAIKSGIYNYLIVGSSAEYGSSGNKYKFIPIDAMLEPTTSYAATKSAFLQLMYGLTYEEDLRVVYSRIFNAFGDGQHKDNFWPGLREAALKGNDFEMTGGEQIRDFIKVEDVVKKLIDQLDFSDMQLGQINLKNIGTGKPQTLRHFAEYWWKKWGASGKLNFGSKSYRKNEMMRFVPKI